MKTIFKSEDELSEAVKLWLYKLNELNVINTFHFHCPNEFKPYKNAAAAWKKKEKIGCVKGAPDWIILSEDKHLLLELKLAKTHKAALKKMSEAQKSVAMSCDNKKINYCLVWDYDSFIAALKKAGFINSL